MKQIGTHAVRGTLLDAARDAKHRAWLANQSFARTRRTASDQLRTLAARGFEFDLDRYRDPQGYFPFDFFLQHDFDSAAVVLPVAPAPRVINLFWTSDNELTPNRRRCIREFRDVQTDDVEVRLITPDNLSDYVLAEAPLHPAYSQLSAIHRSDYLRAYFLHHHGGGYADIKAPSASWDATFDWINCDSGAWLVGYPEQSSEIVQSLHGPLARDVQRVYSRLVGGGAFVSRPRTPLTAEWMTEVNRRMDYLSAALTQHPATDPFGQHADYPVTWIGLMQLVLNPLQLKYLTYIRQDVALTPQFKEFR
ncbi:MAG: capsular polysaccharide synthesis protein [Cryobacterium sp.]|nr:capsular polysaccharide synthesis protein [Cryobacterium sp.]